MAEKLANESAQFLWNNVICILRVEDNALHLKCIRARPSNALPISSFDKSIELIKVISTTCEQDTWNVDEQGEPLLERPSFFSFRRSKSPPCFVLIIYFWSRSEKHCRKLQEIKLQTRNEKDCLDMQAIIQGKLNDELQKQGYVRPNNLLIFLNPISGKKKSISLHKNLISPILKKADVRETVVTTQYQGHVIEFLESTDLSGYDGIVAVGGDGTLSEVVNGVLMMEQQKHGISLNAENSLEQPIQFVKPSLKFGCISSGSSNVINYSSQGTTDPETATLQIICGENHPLDVSSIYDDQGNFLKFGLVITSYGSAAEWLMLHNRFRNFGPARTLVTFAVSLANLRPYPFEITCITRSSDQNIDHYSEDSKCRYPCDQCKEGLDDELIAKFPTAPIKPTPQENFQSNDSNVQENSLSETSSFISENHRIFFKEIRGNLISLNLLNSSCAFHMCPQGLSPSAHFSDGKFDMVIIEETSRKNYFNMLGASMSSTEKYLELPVVKAHRVYGMHFRVPSDGFEVPKIEKDSNANDPPSPSRSTSQEQERSRINRSFWTVDGDKAFDNVNITVWMHRGLVNVFSKGYEKDMVEETSV